MTTFNAKQNWQVLSDTMSQLLFYKFCSFLFFLIGMKVVQGNQITGNGVLVNGNDVMIHTFLNVCVSHKVHKQAKFRCIFHILKQYKYNCICGNKTGCAKAINDAEHYN